MTKKNVPTPPHTCHWPDCEVEVPPAMWGCKTHWMMLPAELRGRIWQHYRPGQEIKKNPSPEYICAALDIRKWILEKINATKAKDEARRTG